MLARSDRERLLLYCIGLANELAHVSLGFLETFWKRFWNILKAFWNFVGNLLKIFCKLFGNFCVNVLETFWKLSPSTFLKTICKLFEIFLNFFARSAKKHFAIGARSAKKDCAVCATAT